jgi:CRP-like cAMP-binding protein
MNRRRGDGADMHYFSMIAASLKPTYFLKGDVIFEADSLAEEMYLVFQGQVEIVSDHETVGYLIEGDYFGELALMSTDEVYRQVAVKALEDCVILRINKFDYFEILDEFPDMLDDLQEYFSDGKEDDEDE